MKNHTKVYMDYFGYGEDDFIPCEVCGNRAVDIHHINCRGMGGSKNKDVIENLMGLCREHHLEYGDIESLTETLQELHLKRMSLLR